MENQLNLNSNVISEKNFKKMVDDVFAYVTESLTCTLGPYGSTTIIEQFGEMHFTKDGWQVLKNIRFSDNIYNNIMRLLVKISFQVVNMVGDGSTTAIVSANSIYKELQKFVDKHPDIRPKEQIDLLNACIAELTSRIRANSISIDDNFDYIKKLALISTNGDDLTSELIKELYVETKNPYIEHRASKTINTYSEIVRGFKLEECTMIDSIYVNNAEDGTCNIKNPYILIFDHTASLEYDNKIIRGAFIKAAQEGRRLVVIAKGYDKYLLSQIAQLTNMEYKTTGTSTIVYLKYFTPHALSNIYLNDFAIMCGGEVFTQSNIDQYEEIIKENGDDFDAYVDIAGNFMGSVENISIGDKDTVITGFINRNEELYKQIKLSAESEYNKLFQKSVEMGYMDPSIHLHKSRIIRLTGNMGIVYVGGTTTLEKNANMDLVEDAIKACESAYNNGWNIGGTLIIPYYCKKIIEEIENEPGEMPEDDVLKIDLYRTIYTSFVNVFKKVMDNKYGEEPSEGYYDNIINNCISKEKIISWDLPEVDGLRSRREVTTPSCYDIVKEEYSTDIMNSCMTDVHILNAAANIISLIVSSNQYITIQARGE